MPTYEYACRDCGRHLEVVQSFTDDPLETCERCGGSLRKVFSAAGIIFKGSGYYVTDTRSERRKASAKTEDGGSSGGDSASTSSETSTSSGGTSSNDAKSA